MKHYLDTFLLELLSPYAIAQDIRAANKEFFVSMATTDGGKDARGKSPKLHKTPTEEQTAVKSKAQLADLFEKNGYPPNVIKTATKAAKLTAQLYTELYTAYSRITLHPETIDFTSGDWPSLRKAFKDTFGQEVPEVEPDNRTQLQTLWLECLWKSRDVSSNGAGTEQEQIERLEPVTTEDELEGQRLAELRRQDEELDRTQEQELETLEQQLAKETDKAASENRVKKDKLFTERREKLLREIAAVNKPQQQLGPGTWNNVQGTDFKRTKANDETDDSQQAGTGKKQRLEDQRRKEREEELRREEESRRKDEGNPGKPSNHDSLAIMTKGLDKWGLLSMVSGFRVAEAMMHRCGKGGKESLATTGLNEVESALLQDQGGRAMTVVSEVIRLLIGPFPTKMLELFRMDPRAFWPIAAFARTNLENMGTNEGFMVQLQVANGVTNTKSTFVKMEEKWETINDLIEPLRRLTNLTFTLDPIYGQCLQGLLGLVTRELTYYNSDYKDRSSIKPYEVERLKAYVEIVRSRFGGHHQTPAHTSKFFIYDAAIMEEAKSTIFDQRSKGERKEGEKAEAADVEKTPNKKTLKNYCPKFNTEAGCETAKCPQMHRCIACGEQGHPRKNCPQKKK